MAQELSKSVPVLCRKPSHRMMESLGMTSVFQSVRVPLLELAHDFQEAPTLISTIPRPCTFHCARLPNKSRC